MTTNTAQPSSNTMAANNNMLVSAVQYGRAGTNETNAKSTQKAYATANKYFQIFLATKSMKSRDELIAEENPCLADIPLLQQFGTFLMEVAKDDKDRFLSVNNAHTIYGNIISPLSKLEYLRGNATFLPGHFNTWYTDARNAMKRFIIKREMLAGHDLSKNKPLSIGRDVLTDLCSILMDENTVLSESQRAALAMAYASIGRGCEVGLSSFNRFDWCLFFDTIEQNWAEIKTGDCDLMNYFSDAFGFEMCVIHSLSGHLMMGGPLLGAGRDGLDDTAKYVFPHLANNIERAATDVSDMMKKIASKSKHAHTRAIASELKSTCLRVGAADTVMNHPSLQHNVLFCAMRGGWEMTNVCRMFEYLQQFRVIIGCAGKALAGYENALQKVVPPCLLFLVVSLVFSYLQFFISFTLISSLIYIPVLQDDPSLRPKVDVFVTVLYAESLPEVAPGNRLAKFGEVMLANELMHLRECYSKHPSHPRFEILVRAAQQCNLCGDGLAAFAILGQLKKWGDFIKLDWKRNNLIEQIKSANEMGEHDEEICALMSRLERDAAFQHQQTTQQADSNKKEVLQVQYVPITSSKIGIF